MINLFKFIGTTIVTGSIAIAGLFGLNIQKDQNLGATIPVSVAVFQTSLQSSISSSATSMTLVNGTNSAGNSLSGYTCFNIDEGTATEEFVCGTASGTSVTSMIRGIDPVDGDLEVTALKKTHRRGASVKITNYPSLAIVSRILNGNETLPNKISYNSHPTFTADTELIDKKYVDDIAISGGVDASDVLKGITKLSVAPASSTNPIAVGDNDTRVPTQGENDALVGTSGTPSSSNKYVTDDDTSATPSGSKVIRWSSGAYPAGDGSALTAVGSVTTFGNGADGDVTINSGSFSSGAITNNALTRDAYFNNLTLSGGNLDTAGYKIYVKGTLTINSTYKILRTPNNGGNGVNGLVSQNPAPSGGAGGSAGSALSAGTIAGSQAGKSGGAGGGGINSGTPNQGTNGTAGSNQTYSITKANGAAGGNGGGTSTGGAGGTYTAPLTLPNTLFTAQLMAEFTSDTALQRYQSCASSGSGAGGKGGTGDPGAAPTYYGGSGGGGGGSGSCGGIIVIFAKTIVNNGSIEAKGGNGGNGGNGGAGASNTGAGSGGGGGAGGSGGTIILVYSSLSGAGTTSVAGGTGGTKGTKGTDGGGGAGQDGVDGSSGNTGTIYQIAI